jgi:segregation and condensation protein A
MTYKVKLPIFEGPLDLLLYLIKKEELDIYDIPITKITDQYLEYLEFMKLLDLTIAGEFLVMAATLMHIKSRMLLPPDPNQEEEVIEEDPREELVRRLLEYKKFKEASEDLKNKEKEKTKTFMRMAEPHIDIAPDDSPFFEASIFDLITAFNKILKDVSKEAFHEVVKDEFTVSEKIHKILHEMVKKPTVYFKELFSKLSSKGEIIATFLALLELIRLKEVRIEQDDFFKDIKIIRNVSLADKPK